MGKSTAAEFFARHGVAIIDTDVIARELVEFGQPALAEIARVFGSDVIDPSGRLNREAMARRVFASSPDREKLEAILHPRIRERWLAEVERLRANGHKACLVVIPLLFETGAQSDLDVVVCVACSADTQRKRLLARGWPPAHIDQRIGAQWPTEKKMTLADYVIWTEGSVEVTGDQIDRLLRSALEREPCS
jgi:dephospho-CoA kinase